MNKNEKKKKKKKKKKWKSISPLILVFKSVVSF